MLSFIVNKSEKRHVDASPNNEYPNVI